MDEAGYHVKPGLGIQMSYVLPLYNVDHLFLHTYYIPHRMRSNVKKD